jgi:TPM domain
MNKIQQMLTAFQQRTGRRFWPIFLAILFNLGVWAIAPNALAYNAPELLPDSPTTIVDLSHAFTGIQKDKLNAHLEEFEAETGWKLRVLTQFDRTPGTAVKDFWNLDDSSVLLVADSRGGNILNFSVGDEIYKILPRTFWVELQTRFGNQFFVREQGEDQAIIQALESVETCLRQQGCLAVPGLPREQWILTLLTSTLGGVIFGFAARPRRSGQVISWQWALLFSPLWGMLFLSFGIGPVVVRTAEWLPILRNVAGFMIGALVAYLTPILTRSAPSET